MEHIEKNSLSADKFSLEFGEHLASSQHSVLICTAVEDGGGQERDTFAEQQQYRGELKAEHTRQAVGTEAFPVLDCGHYSILNMSVPNESESHRKKKKKKAKWYGRIHHRRHGNSENIIFLSKNSGSLKHGMS